jgi:hypothetical protein
MPVSSLTKMTVPIANDQSAANQAMIMPKLQYRFRVTFINFGVSTPTTELTKQVVDITRPNVSFEEIVLDSYNSKVYLAGKHSWQTLTVNLREDVNNNVQLLVGEQLQKQFDFYEQSTGAAGIDYKFTTKIEILDGGNGIHEPIPLETFDVVGCYITNAQYNSLNYATSEVVTTTLEIRYDNAIQTPIGSGVGVPVERTTGTLATGVGA